MNAFVVTSRSLFEMREITQHREVRRLRIVLITLYGNIATLYRDDVMDVVGTMVRITHTIRAKVIEISMNGLLTQDALQEIYIILFNAPQTNVAILSDFDTFHDSIYLVGQLLHSSAQDPQHQRRALRATHKGAMSSPHTLNQRDIKRQRFVM
jgi:predicted nuclease of restriction endonuclease-like RecB superfamily